MCGEWHTLWSCMCTHSRRRCVCVSRGICTKFWWPFVLRCAFLLIKVHSYIYACGCFHRCLCFRLFVCRSRGLQSDVCDFISRQVGVWVPTWIPPPAWWKTLCCHRQGLQTFFIFYILPGCPSVSHILSPRVIGLSM